LWTSSPTRNEDRKELVGAVERLGKAVTLVEIGLHLEGVNFRVGLLGSGHQFPQNDAKGPLE
jgi:hypothetical protein